MRERLREKMRQQFRLLKNPPIVYSPVLNNVNCFLSEDFLYTYQVEL